MYTTGLLTPEHFKWAVHVAGKNMIMHEVKRPELYHRESLEGLANRMMMDGTGILAFYNGRPVGAIGGVLVPHIYNPNIDQILMNIVNKYNVLPQFLYLEITETAYIENEQDLILTLKKLY